MNATVEDLRPTIVPKSDQLNAEQLLGGPMTVTVTDVRLGSGEEQPVVVHYEGEEGRPFKPCKTMRKVLIHAWGADGRKWLGRSMTLYNDHTVKWGGEDVGGIRISHLTHIERDIKVSLTTTRGKKAKYEVKRLVSELVERLNDIARAPNLEALKSAFDIAIKATRVPAERDQLVAAKDKRKGELTKPTAAQGTQEAPATVNPQGRALRDYMADIDNATDGEVAALVLDQARSDEGLTQIDHDALASHWRGRWGDQ
jgi:hypothetical protein